MMAVAASQLSAVSPLTLTMRSPACSPAAAAGAGSSESVHSVRSLPAGMMHSETLPTVRVVCGRPNPQMTTA